MVDGEGWHRGVIGIAATRVVERYHRPAIVISREGEEAFGSGRSIRPFHLLEAVESSHNLFTRYGGHSHACGFAMPSANVPQLRSELDAFARTRLTPADFDPVLEVEAELDLDEITPALFQVLRLLEPYGASNHEPAFSAHGVRLTAPTQDSQRQTHQAEAESGRGQRRPRILSSSFKRRAGDGRTLRSRDPGHSALSSRWRRHSPRREIRGQNQSTENREPKTENCF